MTAQDHKQLCRSTDLEVVEALGAAHETARCRACGRLVTTYADADAAASARPAEHKQAA